MATKLGLCSRESRVWRIYAWLNVALFIGYLLRAPQVTDEHNQFAYENSPTAFANITLAATMFAMWAARLAFLVGLIQDVRRRTQRDLHHWLGIGLGTTNATLPLVLRVIDVIALRKKRLGNLPRALQYLQTRDSMIADGGPSFGWGPSPLVEFRRIRSIFGRSGSLIMSTPSPSACCPGCGQPLPAELAAGPSELQCFQCGAVFANPLRPSTSHGTYGEQLRERPVSTYFFGPKLDAYQGHADPRLDPQRRTQYRVWLLGLLATLAIAVVLPFLIGLVRAGLLMAASAAAYCLFFAGLWALGYGIGLVLFGGALFEKPWFMNSRRAREKRALWGDVKTRNLYMNFGRGVMIATAVISVGNTFLTSAGVLVVGGGDSDDARPPQAAGAAPQVAGAPRQAASAPPEDDNPTPEEVARVQDWEDKVLDERQQLEDVAGEVRAALDEYERLKAESAKNPGDLAMRKQIDDYDRVLTENFTKYDERVRTWKRRVERLQGALVETRMSSDVYDQNAALPPQLTFTKPTKQPTSEQFPTAEVEMRERHLEQAIERIADSQRRRRGMSPSEWRVGAVGRLEENRTRLEEIEQKFGYHSAMLDKIPSREAFAKLIEDADLAARAPNPSVLPSESRPGAPGRGAGAGALPGFPTPPRANFPQPGGSAGGELLDPFDESRQVLRGVVSVRGQGKLKELSLAGANDGAMVEFATPVVEPYVLQTQITRTDGEGPLWLILPIGIPAEKRAVALVVDGAGFRTGLDAVDGAPFTAAKPQPGMPSGQLLPPNTRVLLRCEVAGVRIMLKLGDRPVYHWQGDPKKLSLPDSYQVNDISRLHIGSQNASFRIELPVVTAGGLGR